MILEQQILHDLQNKKNFPYLFASGNIDESYMFICMELLGKSLSDLRKKSDMRRFSPPTAIRVGMQGLEALMTLHDIGYIHRFEDFSHLSVQDQNTALFLTLRLKEGMAQSVSCWPACWTVFLARIRSPPRK